jgi:CubicO group peptidase (beta-lactamase class C family)
VYGVLKKIPYGKIDNLAPAGSISSSVNDMSKWVLMQLDRGKLDGKQVIPCFRHRSNMGAEFHLGERRRNV